MGNQYDSQSISGFNASPPPDDASQVAANQVSWAKHLTKLANPLKTLAEGINTAVNTAFGKFPFYTVRSVSSTDSLVAGDDHKIISCTNTFTFTLLAAATAGNGFQVVVKNAGTGVITLDGDGTETIDGSLTLLLSNQYDSVRLFCDGVNWLVLTDSRVQTIVLDRGQLAGMQLSNNSTDAAHDIDITAGECRGSDDDEDITLASTFVKQIDATWASGSAAGGLSSSLTAPANNTWYHVHAINVGGSADVGFDTSITAANLVTDHTATAYRRLGSVLTDGSANIIGFTQVGEEFFWDSTVSDDDTTQPNDSARTITLTVPTGPKVLAKITATFSLPSPSSGAALFVTSLDQTDEAAVVQTKGQVQVITSASGTETFRSASEINVTTNTSAQIRTRTLGGTSASSNQVIRTFGWRDRRGRDD